MNARAAARLLEARPRPPGNWWVLDCPHCGGRGSIALTVRGWECRCDSCRVRDRRPEPLVARVLVVRGWTDDEIRRALEEAVK